MQRGSQQRFLVISTAQAKVLPPEEETVIVLRGGHLHVIASAGADNIEAIFLSVRVNLVEADTHE